MYSKHVLPLLFVVTFSVSLFLDLRLISHIDVKLCEGVRSITAIFYNTFEYQGYDGRQNVSVWQSCENKMVTLTENKDIKRTFVAKWSEDRNSIVIDTMYYDKHPRYGSPNIVPYRTIALRQLGMQKISSELKIEDFIFLREVSNGCSSSYYNEAGKKIFSLEGEIGTSFQVYSQMEDAGNPRVIVDSKKIFTRGDLSWFNCTTGMSVKINRALTGFRFLILNNSYVVDTEKNEYVVFPSPVDYEFVTR